MADSTHIYTIASGNDPNAKPFFSTNVKNPNGNTVRYFSGTNAEIFFNNLYIDEASSIEFLVNQSTMLIYGYNSYVYDSVAKGSRMIQGNFTINFTNSCYMYNVLNTLQTLENKGKLPVSSSGPLWNKGFDIYLSYGNNTSNPTKADSEQIIKLLDVHLTGSQTKTSGKTGDPIEEVYSFVAKDIDFFSDGVSYVDSYIPNENEKEEGEVPLELTKATLNATVSKVDFELNRGVFLKSAQWKFSHDYIFRNISIDEDERLKILSSNIEEYQYTLYKRIPEDTPIYVDLLLEYINSDGEDEEKQFKYQVK